jgi:hypothetical protein
MSSNPVLERLLAENGLTSDTRLYRETLRKALERTSTSGIFSLAANATPAESVIDVYGQGHTVQAEQVGAGLAFAETPRPEWQDTMEMRVLQSESAPRSCCRSSGSRSRCVWGDILDQGGLIYPVESVAIERAWYCTLPAGSIHVKLVV